MSKLVELPADRVRGRVWTIFICAEPDGQDCDSGTHPNILRHRCAALDRWHEWHQAADRGEVERWSEDAPTGPTIAAVEVAAVNPDGVTVSESADAREAERAMTENHARLAETTSSKSEESAT